MVSVASDGSRNCRCPFGNALRRVMMRERTHQIGEVLVRITEGIHPRIFLKRVIGKRNLEMFQRHYALETKLRGRALEGGDSHGVIERIVQPAQDERVPARLPGASISTAGRGSRAAGTSCGVRRA